MFTLKILAGLIGVLFLLGAVEGLTQNTEQQKKEVKKKSTPTVTPVPTISASSPQPNFFRSSAPAPTPLQASTNSSFIYPSSTIIFSSENSYELATNDDPDSVTNWYKEKINSQNFGAKSVVTTKTNGNVLNKISASGDSKIEIEIKKDNNSSNTLILIRF